MRRVITVLAALYRRWRFVEEEAPPTPAPVRDTSQEELARLRGAAERDEKIIEDFRRHRCDSLAREREASLRTLRSRIRALEMNLRRAV